MSDYVPVQVYLVPESPDHQLTLVDSVPVPFLPQKGNFMAVFCRWLRYRLFRLFRCL